MNDNLEVEREIERYKESLLKEALAKLTPEQRDVFNLLYPKGPSPKQMTWAIQQCRNSIAKNEKKSALGEP